MQKIQNDSADGILWILYYGQLEGFLKGKKYSWNANYFLTFYETFPKRSKYPSLLKLNRPEAW